MTTNKKTQTAKKKLIPGRDALQRYLDEIGDAPLLTDAEERALSERIRQGDQRAADQLATANLRFVVTIARQYLNTHSLLGRGTGEGSPLSPDDLVSEGNIGLLKAASKFDASTGKRFVTFAAPFIRQSIERAIATYQSSTTNHQPPLSTDESLPIGSNNNFTLLNVLEDKDAPRADAHLEQASLSAEMMEATDALNDREKAVITRIYGIGADRMTMAEIGAALGLKRERVRQIRDKALRRMKKLLIVVVLLLAANGVQAQSISHIETTKNWYYIYDQNGKKIKTLSTSQGELKGYSSTFYIIKQGTAFYITYDVNGKRLYTWGASSVGEILGVAGDTFTSRNGAWIYTWSKDGKKISTRAAK
jgi:RNA polymerase primary sigma factor